MTAVIDRHWIEATAKACGFDLCGIARADAFPELQRTSEWLERGYAGEMAYLADPRRTDPQNAMAGARSVIVCALNYNTAHPRTAQAAAEAALSPQPRGWISRYAWGHDYHDVLKTKLALLLDSLHANFSGDFQAKIYADTGPIHERVFAKHAGLGWLGKNTLLLNQHLGSFFFLGVILTTLEFPKDVAPATPPPDLCGTCTRCIDACPTVALVEPYLMDARKCISYLTIELRGPVPEDLRAPIGTHVFGCDICQDVCPWNRRAPATSEPQFQPRTFAESASEQSLFAPSLEWLAALDEQQFRELFRGSPIKRAKYRGLIRNACIALGNSRPSPGSDAFARVTALLQRLASSSDELIAESARWALSSI